MSDFLDIDSKLNYRDPPENYNFELGHTLFQTGKFKRSIPYLKKALMENLDKKNYEDYLFCHGLLLHIFTEFSEVEELKKLQQDFERNSQEFSITRNIRLLTTQAYYFMNIDICTEDKNEENNKKAFEILTEALKSALDSYSMYSKGQDPVKDIEAKIDLMNCLYMFIFYYFRNQEYEKCIKDLDNLKILLNYYFNLKEELQLSKSKTDNFQEQKTYSNVLEIVRKNYQYMQRIKLHIKCVEACVEFEYKQDIKKSDKLLQESYEVANKTDNTYFIPYILFYMAANHANQKDLKQADIFLNLAERNADSDRKLFFKTVEIFKNAYGFGKNGNIGNYDIIFNEEEHSIVEKQKGCVNFKNQFILLDILKLFVSNKGSIYSKQDLVQNIWKQEYSPSTHDNKIYVTIKRLRELIEVDINNPKYICRNNRGYYLNEKAKILVK